MIADGKFLDDRYCLECGNYCDIPHRYFSGHPVLEVSHGRVGSRFNTANYFVRDAPSRYTLHGLINQVHIFPDSFNWMAI